MPAVGGWRSEGLQVFRRERPPALCSAHLGGLATHHSRHPGRSLRGSPQTGLGDAGSERPSDVGPRCSRLRDVTPGAPSLLLHLRLPSPRRSLSVPRCSAGSSLQAVKEVAFRQESGSDGLPWAADPRASTPGGDVPTWPLSPDAVVSATASVQGCGHCYYHRGDASCHGSDSPNDCFSSPRCVSQRRFHYYSSLAFTPRLRAGFPERGELSWGALPPGDPWQCLEAFWASELDRGTSGTIM